jgi:hypothetical protein
MATTEKKKRGKWKAGESGNPNGRPPGVNGLATNRNRATYFTAPWKVKAELLAV